MSSGQNKHNDRVDLFIRSIILSLPLKSMIQPVNTNSSSTKFTRFGLVQLLGNVGSIACISGVLLFNVPKSLAACPVPSTYGSYATTGINKNSTWWLNWECYDDTVAKTASGQPFTFTLPDGSKLTTTVKRTGSEAVITQRSPSWGGAAVGNGQYNGTLGSAVFYSNAAATSALSWQLELSNITVKDSAGNNRNFAIWVADAESTDSASASNHTHDERLKFDTSGPNATNWKLVEIIPQSTPFTTPPTSSTALVIGTTTATWTAPRPANHGSLILSTNNPTSVRSASTPQIDKGGGSYGRQGVFFGVGLPKITLVKNISGRARVGDQFTTQIAYTVPTVSLATATSTGTATATTTGATSVLPGNIISLSETMATGSTSTLASYTGSISCLNANPTSTTLPSGNGTSFSVTPQIGDDITCTLTNAIAPISVSGTVFEDVNYGGGAGRPLSTPTNSPRQGARVELYNASGVFKAAIVTDSNGAYKFDATNVTGGISSGNYTVRVVNSTVTSSRTGYVNTLVPVQTFRTNGLTNNIGTPDPNRVGGEAPQSVDPGNGSTTLLATAQSISPITVVAGATTGIDFGFNFDTIVNTNNSGQGSLRQFITNSNALENTTLNQDPNPTPATGTTAIDPALGDETSIFMIPSSQLTSDGVANINIITSLPQIIGANADKTVIDGRTQTINIGNTNVGTLGANLISKVGVDRLTLDPVDRPEIQITGLSTLAAGLDIQANNVRVEGIAILKFGGTATTNANINIGATFTSPIIKGNVIGATATSFTDPGAGNRSNAYGIFSAATGGTYENNLIGFHGVGGLELNNVTSAVLIKNNEIRGNAIDNSSAEGSNILGGGGATITGNLFIANGGPGVDTSGSSGNNTYTNNTITGNGISTSGQTSGMRIRGSNTLIEKNLIYDNYGAGILVRDTFVASPAAPATTNVKITKNSIYGNGAVSGQIGIDLIGSGGNNNTGTSPFVTLNDNGDGDSGGNGLLNFPVLESVKVTSSNLVVKGFAPAGAAIELFISDDDPSKFGEGKTYLTTVTEGSNADGDGTTGSYGPTAINGVAQGTETNANRFSFTIPLTSLAASPAGKNLTATATVGSTTSEFSGVVAAVTNNPQLVLVKRVTAIGSTAITDVIDDTRATTTAANDNNSKWPTPLDATSQISNVLKGSLTTSKVLPNQEIEYTIYFLSAGNVPIKSVNICDLIPTNTTYVTGSGKISFNGAAPTAFVLDPYIAPGAVTNTAVAGIGLCKSTAANPQTTAGLSAADNPNGLIWAQVDSSRTPPTALAAGEYGYIRFRVLTNTNNPPP